MLGFWFLAGTAVKVMFSHVLEIYSAHPTVTEGWGLLAVVRRKWRKGFSGTIAVSGSKISTTAKIYSSIP